MSLPSGKPPRFRDFAVDGIEFMSSLPAERRQTLERLFFFNPRQAALAERIREVVAQMGVPYIHHEGGRIWLAVPSGSMQCLLACERNSQPVGVALFCRPMPDCLRICHLAVDPKWGECRDGEPSLTVTLVERVGRIGRSIQGVTRVQLPYRRNCFISIKSATIVSGKSERH